MERKKITGTTTERAVSNYSLTKRETEPEHKLFKHYFEQLAFSIENLRDESAEPFDILTIKKQRTGPTMTAADMFSIAEAEGYEEAVFAFCRVPSGGKVVFKYENIAAQKNSSFKAWNMTTQVAASIPVAETSSRPGVSISAASRGSVPYRGRLDPNRFKMFQEK